MYAAPFIASRKYGRKEMSLLRSDSTEARMIFPSRLTTAMDWTFRLAASALSAMTATLPAASVGFDANPTISGNRLTDTMFSRQASNWLSISRPTSVLTLNMLMLACSSNARRAVTIVKVETATRGIMETKNKITTILERIRHGPNDQERLLDFAGGAAFVATRISFR